MHSINSVHNFSCNYNWSYNHNYNYASDYYKYNYNYNYSYNHNYDYDCNYDDNLTFTALMLIHNRTEQDSAEFDVDPDATRLARREPSGTMLLYADEKQVGTSPTQ